MPTADAPFPVDLEAELAHLKVALVAATRAGDDEGRRRLSRLLDMLEGAAVDELERLAAAVDRNVAHDATERDLGVRGFGELILARARDAAKRRLDGVEEAMALAVFAQLQPAAGAIMRAGADRVSEAIRHLWEGDDAGARRAWLAEASVDQILGAMDAATAGAIRSADADAADWQAFLAGVQRAGAMAFRVAAPFLLAALGL